MSGFPNANTIADLAPHWISDARIRLASMVAVQPTGCIEWSGWKCVRGYGRITVGGKSMSAHRLAYELAHGPMPTDRVLDHLCRNPACCNPDHLEPVTQAANIRRGLTGQNNAVKTHCPFGHPCVSSLLARGRTNRCLERPITGRWAYTIPAHRAGPDAERKAPLGATSEAKEVRSTNDRHKERIS